MFVAIGRPRSRRIRTTARRSTIHPDPHPLPVLQSTTELYVRRANRSRRRMTTRGTRVRRAFINPPFPHIPMLASLLPRATRAPLFALAALPLFAVTAAAQPGGPSFQFVIEGAGEFGGDAIATVFFEDGSTQEVHGGQGVTLAGGGELRPSAGSPLALRGTVGFKFVTTKATNADITLTRVPVEVVATYDLPGGMWVGGGYVRHTALQFEGDDIGPDMEFDDANGATAELGWRWVALTYTAMRYTDAEGAEYDASNVGLSFIYRFGRR
jgi:hypothetical protein